MGAGKLSLKGRPTDMPTKQAAAAVGQCELMYAYDRLFSQHNHTVAQLLLTGSDIEDEKRRANFHNTMFRLLELGALPVINETTPSRPTRSSSATTTRWARSSRRRCRPIC